GPATEPGREQLEQIRDQVAALLAAASAPRSGSGAKAEGERSALLANLPVGPRGGGCIEWKKIRQGNHVYGPYPYLRVELGGRRRSIYLKALAQATRASARREGHV